MRIVHLHAAQFEQRRIPSLARQRNGSCRCTGIAPIQAQTADCRKRCGIIGNRGQHHVLDRELQCFCSHPHLSSFSSLPGNIQPEMAVEIADAESKRRRQRMVGIGKRGLFDTHIPDMHAPRRGFTPGCRFFFPVPDILRRRQQILPIQLAIALPVRTRPDSGESQYRNGNFPLVQRNQRILHLHAVQFQQRRIPGLARQRNGKIRQIQLHARQGKCGLALPVGKSVICRKRQGAARLRHLHFPAKKLPDAGQLQFAQACFPVRGERNERGVALPCQRAPAGNLRFQQVASLLVGDRAHPGERQVDGRKRDRRGRSFFIPRRFLGKIAEAHAAIAQRHAFQDHAGRWRRLPDLLFLQFLEALDDLHDVQPALAVDHQG